MKPPLRDLCLPTPRRDISISMISTEIWTEKTVSYRSSSDGAFQSSTVIKRSLTR
jgi:hypothetical protein